MELSSHHYSSGYNKNKIHGIQCDKNTFRMALSTTNQQLQRRPNRLHHGQTNLGASIDNIIQWAADNNMYVIFNLHWGSGFNAPDWVPTVSTSTGCTSGDDGRAVDIFGDANIRAGISYIYNYMGTRYATKPNVIYEGINELLTPNDNDAAQPFANFNNQWISAMKQEKAPTTT